MSESYWSMGGETSLLESVDLLLERTKADKHVFYFRGADDPFYSSRDPRNRYSYFGQYTVERVDCSEGETHFSKNEPVRKISTEFDLNSVVWNTLLKAAMRFHQGMYYLFGHGQEFPGITLNEYRRTISVYAKGVCRIECAGKKIWDPIQGPVTGRQTSVRKEWRKHLQQIENIIRTESQQTS